MIAILSMVLGLALGLVVGARVPRIRVTFFGRRCAVCGRRGDFFVRAGLAWCCTGCAGWMAKVTR